MGTSLSPSVSRPVTAGVDCDLYIFFWPSLTERTSVVPFVSFLFFKYYSHFRHLLTARRCGAVRWGLQKDPLCVSEQKAPAFSERAALSNLYTS
jgi:hypothetical protein